MTDRILGVLDRLAPDAETPSREERRRARAIVAATLIGSAILAATAFTTLALGIEPHLVPLNLGWSVAVLVLLGVARRMRSLSLLANTLVAMGFAHTLLLSSMAGGRNIGALFGFAVFPLLAVLLSGWRSGLAFTGLSAAAVVLTQFVPVTLLAPNLPAMPEVSTAIVRDSLNVIFAVGLVAVLYDLLRGATLLDAEESRARAEEAVSRQQQLVELSRRLHEAEGERFDQVLSEVMEQIAHLAGANRTLLQLVDRGGFGERFAWGDGSIGEHHAFEDASLARRTFRYTARSILEGRITNVRRLADLPPEAQEEKDFLEARGVASWLCVPIRAAGHTIGYQSFETLVEKVWDEEQVAAFQLMTELLASAVVRHRSEEALRESEEKFALAFRDHPDAMIILDLETDEIIECNEQWLVEAGVESREEVLGKTPWDFGFGIVEEQRELMRQTLLADGQLPAVELPVRVREGEMRTYLISGTRIDLGGRACAVANIHDLTERNSLEQQLLHAQKMEAVGRLAGGVAHDYNNMLTVISGYSASLVDNLDGELRSDAMEIHEAARRSAELTRQLLAFSRRQVLQTEVLDVNQLLCGLESMLRPLIGESIALHFDLDPEPGHVSSDRGQLEQAVVNLVVNGRDAMPNGGTLSVATRRVTLPQATSGTTAPLGLDPGVYVMVCVEDEGEGMDPDLVDHAMEPFYTTKPEGEGTGLGLPMVHGLARQCGGALALDSVRGRGTRVTLYLPEAEEPCEIRNDPLPQNGSGTATAAHCVLLAEDEEKLRRLAARTLRSVGYEVIEVADGSEALERAAALGDELDLLVSDVVMPRLSGIDLVQALRAKRPDLPVILMSGYPDTPGGSPVPSDVLFLLKPFGPERLRDAVAEALRGKQDESSD